VGAGGESGPFKTLGAKVTIEVPVDESRVDFCTKYNDLFRTDHCGYWAFGVALDGGEAHRPTEEESVAAETAHEKGEPLPEHWFALTRETAIKAFGEGVKRGGAFWYDDTDASDYDCAVQMALLGEIKYG
jgi:hypothetical protein